MHPATYIHCFFLILVNVTYIHICLSYFLILRSYFHLLFLLISPRDTLYNLQRLMISLQQKKTLHNQNKYFSITIFGTKYELFLLHYQITFFLVFGQAKISFSYHILTNILICLLFCDTENFHWTANKISKKENMF